jgi:hypothetical protein
MDSGKIRLCSGLQTSWKRTGSFTSSSAVMVLDESCVCLSVLFNCLEKQPSSTIYPADRAMLGAYNARLPSAPKTAVSASKAGHRSRSREAVGPPAKRRRSGEDPENVCAALAQGLCKYTPAFKGESLWTLVFPLTARSPPHSHLRFAFGLEICRPLKHCGSVRNCTMDVLPQ